MADYFNSIITKANAKDKVIDFRDQLTVASPADYAQIHGVGGSGHAAKSTIRVTICDYTKGTGDSSVTVAANLTPEMIALLHYISKEFLVHPAVKPDSQTNGCVSIPNGSYKKLEQVLKTMRDAAKSDEKNLSNKSLIQCGKLIKEVTESVQTSKPKASQPIHEYDYSQDRVNHHKKGTDGLASNHAPVNKLTIFHQAWRNESELSKYPWQIKISNGEAEVKEGENGSISYVGSTFKLKNEAFIMLSDLDMFRMMERCAVYIRTFEESYGIPLVAQGVAERMNRRQK